MGDVRAISLGIQSALPERKLFVRRKGSNMSLCLNVIYNNEMYVAADSRSSIVRKRSMRNKNAVSVDPVDDTYYKIIPFAANGQQFVLISTGRNTFGIYDSPISEIIKSVNFSQCLNVWDVCVKIREKFVVFKSLSSTDLSVSLYWYENNSLCEADMNFTCDAYPINIRKHIQPSDLTVSLITQGVGYGMSIAEYYPFPVEKEEENETVLFINDFYSKIFKISDIMERSVGGLVRIGKLTPEGFTWLQNGYEL